MHIRKKIASIYSLTNRDKIITENADKNNVWLIGKGIHTKRNDNFFSTLSDNKSSDES